MAATNIPYADAGMADWQTEQFTDVEVFAGEVPPRWTSEELLDPSMIVAADFPAFSVVGRIPAGSPGAGNLVLADPSAATPVQPIGITTAPVRRGSVNLNVAIFRSGSYNFTVLNWAASYSSDVLKRRAFDYSPGLGAAFCLKKPNYAGVFY